MVSTTGRGTSPGLTHIQGGAAMKPTQEEYQFLFEDLRYRMGGDQKETNRVIYALLVSLHNHITDHEFLHATQPLQVGEDGIVITGDPS
jgi:hypothetical protein